MSEVLVLVLTVTFVLGPVVGISLLMTSKNKKWKARGYYCLSLWLACFGFGSGFSLVSRAYFFQTRDDERFETNTNARTHRSSDEREGEKNNYAPVYCSTSDFTHPLSPSSNVSKNAAPSNFCCSFPFAAEREDPVVTNATVATVAIVFNPPILFTCAVFDR